jgi:hypothetical protein
MGDMGDVFRMMRENKKENHARFKESNIKNIIDSKIPCTIKDEVVLFREQGKPHIDYYPSSNRWKVIKKPNHKMMYGNAIKFIVWYEKQ